MDEAIQLLFSPYVMRLLEAASVRESVVSLVHAGLELEDSVSEQALVRQYQALTNDAIESLRTCAPYNCDAPTWVDHLFYPTLLSAVEARIIADSERYELEEEERYLASRARAESEEEIGDD